jgi:hypothetical protein
MTPHGPSHAEKRIVKQASGHYVGELQLVKKFLFMMWQHKVHDSDRSWLRRCWPSLETACWSKYSERWVFSDVNVTTLAVQCEKLMRCRYTSAFPKESLEICRNQAVAAYRCDRDQLQRVVLRPGCHQESRGMHLGDVVADHSNRIARKILLDGVHVVALERDDQFFGDGLKEQICDVRSMHLRAAPLQVC